MHLNGKKLGMDRNGGIEGLPLQLLIIVLVAGVGSAIIMGWMGGLEAPESIGSVHSSMNEILLSDDDSDGIYCADGMDICITVLDQSGDPIAGASVSLEGSGVQTSEGKRPHGVTDASGKANFEGLTLSRASSTVGYLTITVAKTGLATAKSISVPVISE